MLNYVVTLQIQLRPALLLKWLLVLQDGKAGYEPVDQFGEAWLSLCTTLMVKLFCFVFYYTVMIYECLTGPGSQKPWCN